MTQRILAIDPGNTRSALVDLRTNDPTGFDGRLNVIERHYADNAKIREILAAEAIEDTFDTELVIEKIESFGMAVGAEVFETVFATGRFAELWESRSGKPAHRLGRGAVKMFLCRSMKAKDPNIRQAVMDRFGSSKDVAIGTKKSPGPLYGVSGDQWSAIAVALTFHATQPALPVGA